MKYIEVEKILQKNGWVKIRTNGSHIIFAKSGVAFKPSVPCHGGKDISIGVLKSLERGTGLSFL